MHEADRTRDLTAQKKVHLIISTLVTSEKLPEKSLSSISLSLSFYIHLSLSCLTLTMPRQIPTSYDLVTHTEKFYLSLALTSKGGGRLWFGLLPVIEPDL